MPDEKLVKPVSLDLDAAIKKAVADIPTGAKGQAGVAVTHRGVEVSVGTTLLQRQRVTVTTGGYAARLWGGSWQYGARTQIVWR